MNRFLVCLSLFFVAFMISSCCTFRNYTLFSEPVPVFDSAKEFQCNLVLGLTSGEACANISPVNHVAVIASASVRSPLSFSWLATESQIGAGYFKVQENHGFEILGGWGSQDFRRTYNTCSFRPRLSGNSEEFMVTDTFFHYNFFFLQPDVWWRTGKAKFIAALNFQEAYAGKYDFYLERYTINGENSIHHNETVYQYAGPFRVLIAEPSLQLRLGQRHVRFLMEAKYSFPIAGNINLSKYFSEPSWVFSLGMQFVFHANDFSKLFYAHHH